MENQTCQLCGAELDPAYRFCPMCGRILEVPKTVASGLTLQDAYLAWLPTRESNISRKSMDSYRRAWVRVESYSRCDVSHIHADEVQRIINGLSYEDAKKLRSLLRQVYDIANAKTGCSYNPIDSIRLPKRVLRRRNAFAAKEIEKMWHAYRDGDVDAAYPLILIYTGMRTGEFLSLRECNINFDSRVISGVGTKSAASALADIILPQAIIPVLQSLCTGVPQRRVVPYANATSYYKRYYACLQRLGVRCLCPHCCRHTYASMLASHNMTPVVIQRAMRHADYQTTAKTYTHLDPGYIHDALDSLT